MSSEIILLHGQIISLVLSTFSLRFSVFILFLDPPFLQCKMLSMYNVQEVKTKAVNHGTVFTCSLWQNNNRFLEPYTTRHQKDKKSINQPTVSRKFSSVVNSHEEDIAPLWMWWVKDLTFNLSMLRLVQAEFHHCFSLSYSL